MKSMTGIFTCISLCLALFTCSSCGRQAETFDLSEENIRADTQSLCVDFPDRVAGTKTELAACDWLERALNSLGFDQDSGCLIRQTFAFSAEASSQNLIAVYQPDAQRPLVHIISHYDSYPGTPGAGDNGAGTAILLEIARYLSTADGIFDCEIRLVFLGAEENGYHGSRAYVDSLSPEDRARHLAAYNMDISASAPEDGAQLVCCTLGGTGEDGTYQEGNFLEPMENLASRTVSAAFQELYGDGFGGVCHVGESDHISFHLENLEAANVCWRKLEGGLPQLPTVYHKPEDTPDRLDYGTARVTGRCILRAVQLLTSEYSA